MSRRPFGRLLGSYTINELGDSVGVVALALLVYENTGNAAATAALFVAAKFVPAFAAPAFTARTDQLDLRMTLAGLYLAEAAAFAALAFLAGGRFLLPLVLVLALVDGTLAITARALTRGAVGTLLQPLGLLKQGNGLMNVGFAAASVGGAALAGLLVSQFGLAAPLLVDCASFLIVALMFVRTKGLPEAHVERQKWRERLRGGLSFARTSPIVRLLLFGEGAALVFFTLVIPIEVIYARESLGTTSAGFGVLVASWGAGIVLGSLFYLVVKGGRPLALVVLSTASIGLAYCGMAVSNTLVVACLFSIFGGVGNGIQWVAVITGLQEATPPHLQARVVGLMESMNAAMPGVGFVLGAAIVTLGSPRTAYGAAGVGVLVLVGLATASLPFIHRHSTAGAPEAEARAAEDALVPGIPAPVETSMRAPWRHGAE